MAKRTNPYSEDFIPQSKVHVGIKQFNNNEERLQKVYEKTLELLFNGAKKIPAANLFENPTSVACNRKNETVHMKQLFIGKDGNLLHSGKMISLDKNSTQCSCGGAVETACAYCERLLCGTCQHYCKLCEHFYCSHCSLIGSEGAEVCVSCYD